MKRIYIITTIVAVLLLPVYVHAQDDNSYQPLAEIPEVTMNDQDLTFTSYLQDLFVTIISLATVVAVLMIVIGGIRYAMSDAVSSKEGAKSQINGAVIGLILMLAAWLILNTINPDILNFAGIFGAGNSGSQTQEEQTAQEFCYTTQEAIPGEIPGTHEVEHCGFSTGIDCQNAKNERVWEETKPCYCKGEYC